MTTKDIAGKTVQVNEEGFMTDPNEWTNLAGDRQFDEVKQRLGKWMPRTSAPAPRR